MILKKTMHKSIIVLLSALFLFSIVSCESCKDDKRTSFGDIVSTTSSDYDNYQMKFTFTGTQTSPITSVVFGSSPTNMASFTPYRRSDLNYLNDDFPFASFAASGAEMERIVKAIEGDPIYTDNTDKAEPLYSFMIMRDTGGPDEKVFETLVLPVDGPRLFTSFILPNLDPGNLHGKELCTFFLKNVGG